MLTIRSKTFIRHAILGLAMLVTTLVVRAEIGVTNDEIHFGQSTALTGALAKFGYDSSIAAKAYFDFINAQGGIHGRKIRLVTLDDGDDARQGLENTKLLIEKEKVFALFNVSGTATNLAIMPLINSAAIPNIAPDSGAEALRKPHNPLVFNIRASYTDEAEAIVNQLSILGMERVAVVFENNTFGKDGLSGVEQGLKQSKMKVVASAPIQYDGADADKAAALLQQSNAQSVIMITGTHASVEFIKAYNKRTKGMLFYMLSVMGTPDAVDALGKDGVGAVVAQAMPYPFSATSDIVREYQQVMPKMQGKNWTYRSIEGFISAKIAVEGLRRAGRKLTRERYLAALDSIGKVDLGGYPLHFTPSDHRGSKFVELTLISKNGGFLR